MIVKNNHDIKSLNILGNAFQYTAYPDETTFLLKNMGSIKVLLNTVFFIFIVFRFKTKLIKMQSSRDSTIERDECGSVWNQMYWELLRTWWRRNLTIEGKIIIFKTLALSKIMFLAQVLLMPNEVTTTTQRKQG